MEETVEEQKSKEESELYSKITEIIKCEIYSRPSSRTFWAQRIKSEYNDAVQKISEKTRKVFESYIRGLNEKINIAEGELLNLRTTNAQQREKISELETSLKTEKESYESLIAKSSEYESVLKEIARKLPEDILNSDLYERKEKSIGQAEIEDAEEGMEEMGFERTKETDIGTLGITEINTES